MRIAFAGTHRVGKTTLVEAVAARLRGYVAFEEPYRILEDAGHEFSDPPTVEDFERQLHQSIAMITGAPARALFDRCPLDFVAYAQALDEGIEVDAWIDAARDAMQSLDLIVLVPIEMPDRIVLPAHEDRRFRARVDERVRTLILDDELGLGIETLEVSSTLERRLQQVLAVLPPG
jgi:predicted ATPase